MQSSNVPEAPIFRPTVEEWKQPLAYISNVVRKKAENLGIAKVVPPQPWNAPFQLDEKHVRLPCQLLMVHHLYNRDSTAAEKQFWADYNACLEVSGARLKKRPTYLGQDVDLYRLYRAVRKRGGYQTVTEDKAWKDILWDLQLIDKNATGAASLRQHYQRLLLPFEEHEKEKVGNGAGLLERNFNTAAAMEIEDSKPCVEEIPEDVNDILGDDEAAEILEAMLGLAPAALATEAPKKKRRNSMKQEQNPSGSLKISAVACEKCNGSHFEDKIVLCDRCAKGWHMFCVSPPLDAAPDGEWICPACIARDFEAGASRPCNACSLEELRRAAANFEARWFGSEEAAKLADDAVREEQFWRIVQLGEDPVEVICSNNIDTRLLKSKLCGRDGSSTNEIELPAPHVDEHESAAKAVTQSPWSLNDLPKIDGEHCNLMRFLDRHVPGMTASFLHSGMLFSADTWELAPHLLYSISYLHEGAPKKWYSVAGSNAAAFEAALREAVPAAFATQPDLLYDPQTMISPTLLHSRGVSVSSILQEPGTFILTFPNAYRTAIDLGFNISESIYIAPADWLRFGAMSVSRLRCFRQKGEFSHEALLIKAAHACEHTRQLLESLHGDESEKTGNVAHDSHKVVSSRTAYWLAQEMNRIEEEERILRSKLWKEGLTRSRPITEEDARDSCEEADLECSICGMPLHVSAVECDCCEGRHACLHHAENLCECPLSRMRLIWRYTLQQLQELQAAFSFTSPSDGLAGDIEAEERIPRARGDDSTMIDNVTDDSQLIVRNEQNADENKKECTIQDEDNNASQNRRRSSRNRARTSSLSSENQDIRTVPRVSPRKRKKEAGADDTNVNKCTKRLVGKFPGSVKEPEDMRENLAGLDVTSASPKEDSASTHLPIVQAYSNGFVQGPVRPFQMVDIYPEDREAVAGWVSAMKQKFAVWHDRARVALGHGGLYASELSQLVEEAEQFAWGGAGTEATRAVADLQPRLAAAEDYMAAVNAALHGKPYIEVVEALLSQDPKPLQNPPGLERLRNTVEAAKEWRSKFAKLAEKDAPSTDPRSLEAAVAEASRLPITIPEARLLRERLNTSRKVSSAIREALPTAREAGRRKQRDNNPVTLEYLEELHEAAASTNLEIPEDVNLSAMINRMHDWQARAEEALELRVPLLRLQGLVEEAESFPAVLPEVKQIADLIKKAESWIQQSRHMLGGRPALKKLRDLLHVGLRLAVEVPEVEELRKEIRRREWEESARRSANSKGTIHALTEALNQANDMGVQDSALAQSLQLRVDAALEWEARARSFYRRFEGEEGCLESQRPSLDELQEIVDSGMETGVKMERLQTLNRQLVASGKWLTKASQFILGASRQKELFLKEQDECLDKIESPNEVKEKSKSSVSSLAQDPSHIIDVKQENENGQMVKAESSVSTHGISTVPPCEGKNEDGQTLPLKEPIDREVGDDDHSENDGSLPSSRRSTGSRRASKGPGRPRNPTAPPSPPRYENIQSSIEEYDEDLIVQFKEINELRELKTAADRWLEEARPILEQDSVQDEQMPLLLNLVAQGKATGVAMEQIDILEANVEALQWEQQIHELLAHLPELPTDPSTPLDLAPYGTSLLQKTPVNAQESEIKTSKAVQKKTRSTSSETAPPTRPHQNDATEPENSAAEGDVANESPDKTIFWGVPPPDDEVDGALASTFVQGSPLPSTPYDQRPFLQHMVELLEEGHILPCNDDLFATFRKYVEAGLEWERGARSVLAVSKDGTPVSLVHVRSLRQYIARGERLGIGIPALPRLHEILRAHDKWEGIVRNLMATAGERPALNELQVFQRTSRQSPVTSNLRRHIDAVIEAVEEWMDGVRRLVAKRNSGLQIDRCLEMLSVSVDAGIEQFERRLELEKKGNDGIVATEDIPHPGASSKNDSRGPHQRFCLCQQLYSDELSMIKCGTCREWFHMKCVGLTQSQARSLRKFQCPICRAVRNDMDPLEGAIGKLRKTRRASRDDLYNTLEDIRSLPVTVDEEKLLEQLLNRYDRWSTATNRAIEVHEASWKNDAASEAQHLSDGMLHQLCRSALAMEIDSMEHAEKILHLLRCNRWRMRVDAVFSAAGSVGALGLNKEPEKSASLSAHGKATIDSVAKLLKEADPLNIDVSEDKAGHLLLEAVKATREWQNAMLKCINDIKKAKIASDPGFVSACNEAQDLIQRAMDLPISVERDVAKLKEYAKPYCLCESVYDDQIPMIECDKCGEWYHFECVGLKAPGSAQITEEEEELPEHFNCPICCMKGGDQYRFFSKLPQQSINALKETAGTLSAPVGSGSGVDGASSFRNAAGIVPSDGAVGMSSGAMFASPWPLAIGPRGITFSTVPMAMANPQAMAQMMEAFQAHQQNQDHNEKSGIVPSTGGLLLPASGAFPHPGGMMWPQYPMTHPQGMISLVSESSKLQDERNRQSAGQETHQ